MFVIYSPGHTIAFLCIFSVFLSFFSFSHKVVCGRCQNCVNQSDTSKTQAPDSIMFESPQFYKKKLKNDRGYSVFPIIVAIVLKTGQRFL